MDNTFSRLCRILASILPLLVTLTINASGSHAADQSPLKKVADIPLPGSAVRFDYQSLDTSQGRLYIAHMNANQLVVFDMKKRAVIANLDGFSSVHGVCSSRTGQSLRFDHGRTHRDCGRYGDFEEHRQSGDDQVPGWHC